MNNLLRTLTQRHGSSSLPDSDLRLLLTTVKDTRRQYAEKLADPFYESLEGLLHDLRTVTVDNRDAEAFLKPVARQEAPDYADIIHNPMDLGTMLKKVRSKQYKSKREFSDDLSLIWDNCYAYNAAENHPLRQCVTRLRAKADVLLAHITDRRERTDPYIPLALTPAAVARPPPGVAHVKPHAPNGAAPSRPASANARGPGPKLRVPPGAARPRPHEVPFPETPALVRTAEGMGAFATWDRELDAADAAAPAVPDAWRAPPSKGERPLEDRLRDLLPEDDSSPDELTPLDGPLGEKRKLNGADRPRKRARVVSRGGSLGKEAVELWWDVVQADNFGGNGMPPLPHASTSHSPLPPSPSRRPSRDPARGADGAPANVQRSPTKRVRRATISKAAPRAQEPGAGDGAKKTSLLALMSDNIRTVKRVRRAHAKLTALAAPEEPGAPPPEADEVAGAAVVADEGVDDRPWRGAVGSNAKGKKGRRKGRGRGNVGVGPVDGEAAENCLQWMSGRVLEHAGFQGTSKMAVDVIADIAAEYLQNVGRMMGFLSEKYSRKMTPEEIILHTLFESGITEVQDLERYVQDDVVRHGSRMVDLEKKLVNAYAEAAVAGPGEAMDDDALFADTGDQEEDGQFVMGEFADALGDDFLGLKELGIADEFGLTSLNVPKRLLRPKSKADAMSASAAMAKTDEPPLPYPLPLPFEPLRAGRIDDQIGLLQPYLVQRFAALAVSSAPHPDESGTAAAAALNALPPMPGITMPVAAPPPADPALPDAPPAPAPDLALPDEQPDAGHCKLGPLGQVLKSATPSANASKKKAAPPKPPKPPAEPPRPVGRPPKNRPPGAPPLPPPAKKKKVVLAPAPPQGAGGAVSGALVAASA